MVSLRNSYRPIPGTTRFNPIGGRIRGTSAKLYRAVRPTTDIVESSSSALDVAFAQENSPISSNSMKSIPGLPWIVNIKPERGDARLVLFTDNPRRDCKVFQIGDFEGPSYRATELIAPAVQDYKEAVGIGISVSAQLLLKGPIEIFKYGSMMFCCSDHFFARFCYDYGLWVLDGLSDGIRGGVYYPVQHPIGESIVVDLAMGPQGVHVQEVKLVSDGKKAIIQRATAKQIKDVLRPRHVSGPENCIQRVYVSVSSGHYRLHVLTLDRVYEYRELGKGQEGFFPTLTTTLEGLPAQTQNVRHRITEFLTVIEA